MSLVDNVVYHLKKHHQVNPSYVIAYKSSYHYEIMTLKIALKIFVTLKRHGNHIEKYLQRKLQ